VKPSRKRLNDLREPEIQNLDRCGVRDEDVSRLQVAMHDPPGVRSREAVGELQDHVEKL